MSAHLSYKAMILTSFVSYTTTGGWVLDEVHLYVGTYDEIPMSAGNPQIGLFPYSDNTNGATTWSYTVPIPNETDDCFAIAAHAAVSLLGNGGNVIQSETAWSDGDPTNGSSWAMISEYCLCDTSEPCIYTTATYEYYGGININIGTLEVTNDETNLYVTYNLVNGWHLQETQVYVGDPADIPTFMGNPAPGLFPYKTEHNPMVTTYTYTIPLASLPACYAIAAHSAIALVDADGSIIQTETGWSDGTPFPSSWGWGWYSEYCTQVCGN